MSADTRQKLLQAAEHILLTQGVSALTVRQVGKVSGLNPTLITYHFGTVSKLLGELCDANLAPMEADWADLDAGTALDEILVRWLRPLQRPAAFHPEGRALVVLDEIATHSDGEAGRHIMDVMVALAARVQIALQPLLPALPPRELRARLRFISGAVLGPPPRARGSGRTIDAEAPLDGLDYLLAFARAALRP